MVALLPGAGRSLGSLHVHVCGDGSFSLYPLSFTTVVKLSLVTDDAIRDGCVRQIGGIQGNVPDRGASRACEPALAAGKLEVHGSRAGEQVDASGEGSKELVTIGRHQ